MHSVFYGKSGENLANLPWLILQPSVASTKTFYDFSHEPLALLLWRRYHEKLFDIYFLEVNLPAFLFGGNPLVDGTFWATARCCSGPLWVGIP
jgi:hypothetical protein